MQISTKLAKGKYDHNQDNETHLLVTLEAPKVEWDKERAPICLVPVLDVSGSMMGQKLDYVKKACRKLIDHLSPGDMMGIVAFDSHVHEVAPIQEITQYQKEELKNKVAKLQTNSCTNLAGGLGTAMRWVNEMNLASNVVLRVIVFTDGHANVGISNHQALMDFSMEHRGKASISCFGFGNGCNQELLADISEKSNGNYAFIDSPDAAMTAFARELGGLVSIYAQDIKISITPDKNNEVLEILNDEDVDDKDGTAIVSIQDILGEEKKFIVAKVKLSSVEKALPRKVNAFKVDVSYSDTKGDRFSIEDQTVKVTLCKPGQEPVQEDAEVVLHRDRLLAARAQDQADAFVLKGDFASAVNVMQNCSVNLVDEGVKAAFANTTSNYTDRNTYNSTRGLSSSMKKMYRGSRMSYGSSEVSLCADSLGYSFGNSTQDALEAAFKADDDGDTGSSGTVTSSTTADQKDPKVTNVTVEVENDQSEEKTSETKSKTTAKKRRGSDW